MNEVADMVMVVLGEMGGADMVRAGETGDEVSALNNAVVGAFETSSADVDIAVTRGISLDEAAIACADNVGVVSVPAILLLAIVSPAGVLPKDETDR